LWWLDRDRRNNCDLALSWWRDYNYRLDYDGEFDTGRYSYLSLFCDCDGVNERDDYALTDRDHEHDRDDDSHSEPNRHGDRGSNGDSNPISGMGFTNTDSDVDALRT
jgi:hypothetical protein